MRKISIVILSYNTLPYTKACINSIRQYTTAGTYEIVVVDNGSRDGSVDWLKKQSDLYCIYNIKNVGFPAGCNQGMKSSKGNDILLLNSDTIVTPRWLDNLCTALYSDPQIGAVSCVTNHCSNMQQIEVPYKTVQGIFTFADKYNHSDAGKWEKKITLVGFCMLIKHEVYKKVGAMDERFSPGNYEDDDYSLRIWQAGYRLLLCRDTFIHHFGSASFVKAISEQAQEKKNKEYMALLHRNRVYFREKWGVSEYYKVMDLNVRNFSAYGAASARILVFDCGCGGDLCYLAAKYKNARLYGITTNEAEAAIAQRAGFSVQVCHDYLAGIFQLLDGAYDYIFIRSLPDNIVSRPGFLQKLEHYLTSSGMLYFWFQGKSWSIDRKAQTERKDNGVQSVDHVERILDSHKICFISCVNDEAKYQQCVEQIRHLDVPEGMQVDLVTIHDAASMAEGYQRGMLESDAKYKIYLHQDVWLVQPQFLSLLIACFKEHPEYGIAGVVGSATMPANGIWWESPELLGMVYDDHDGFMRCYQYRQSREECEEAIALDGLCLATQYDVDWRFDLFNHWHFYDLSQCLEFRRKGYMAVVLPQGMPFCMHYCGMNAMKDYENERKKFIREYKGHVNGF